MQKRNQDKKERKKVTKNREGLKNEINDQLPTCKII